MAYKELNTIKRKIPEWIEKGFSSKEDIDLIEDFGKYIADAKEGKNGKWFAGRNAISTSQIRIAYGEVTRLKMQFDETAMMLLRPKIAYAAARDGGYIFNDFQKIISTGVDAVSASQNKKAAFNNLANIFEAILAYHKAYGGN